MILVLALACPQVESPPVEPPVGGDGPRQPVAHLAGVHPDAPARGEAPAWSVRVDPALPAYNDHLRCVLEGTPPSRLQAIAWTVDGAPWTGDTATTTYSGDTIHHLDQSGGQAWFCAALLSSGERTHAAAVVIGHPVAMVRVPAGSTPLQYPRMSQTTRVTISRAFWMAEAELSRAEWISFAGYDASEERVLRELPNEFDLPTTHMTGEEAMWFTNLVSQADGLPPCYSCIGSGPTVACTRPHHAAECTGYRLPTQAEWVLAYREGGAHEDPLPAGGYWTPRLGDDMYGSPYDAEALGPHAPPNSKISHQCWMTIWMPSSPGDRISMPMPVRTLMPNALGLYDMCSNMQEFFTDPERHPPVVAPVVDPLVPGDGDYTGTGSTHSVMSFEYANAHIGRYDGRPGPNAAIRLTRTIHGGQP